MTLPTVSVALCTCNGARFLPEQLESIRAQTFAPAELVVNDDCSNDDTLGVLEEFARAAPFPVRINVNAQRLGSVSNFDRALARCSAEIIVLCDQDDVWKARKLETIASSFSADAQALAIFTDAELVDLYLEPLGETLFHRLGFTPKDASSINEGDALRVLLRKTVVCGATLALRSTFRQVALPIPPITRKCWDHDGWIALLAAACGGLRVLTEPLILYRQHPRQQIGIEPQGRGVLMRIRGAREFRTQGINCSIADLSSLLERLRSVPKIPAQSIEMLQDKIDHLHSRAAILQSSLGVSVIGAARELYTRRYHRYSAGLSSATGDCLL